jgi:TolA-binding protein
MTVRPENCTFDMQQTVGELPVLDQAWAWLVVNKKQVLWGAGAVLVAGIAIGTYVWRKQAVEVSASDALSRVEALNSMPGRAREESADAYLKVANEHAGTGGGERALLQAGAVLFTQGKYAEAQTQFQRFSRDYPDSSLRGQAMLGNAACLDALAKPDEAAAAYKSTFEQRPGEAAATQARFALARIYEYQSKLEQARPLYEEVARTEPNSSIGNEAGLKAEELRAKSPPPAATNAVPAATTTAPVLSPPPAAKTN